MKPALVALALALSCTACSRQLAADKEVVIENDGKARAFVAAYGMPSPALVAAQQWPKVAKPLLVGVTWHVIPGRDATQRWSVMEEGGTQALFLALEHHPTHSLVTSRELDVFGPIALPAR
jgi:hypothetical protein